MGKINVHVLEFYSCQNSHTEIVLQEKIENEARYYNINLWASPRQKAEEDNRQCLKLLGEASNIISFEIEGDLNEIVAAWQQKHESVYPESGACSYNCADTVAWFLETFANIPNPGSCGKPITCNYMCCGLFAPSFLQCCTLPGRVADYAKQNKSQENTPLLAREMTK